MKKIRKISLIEPKSATYHTFSQFALPRLGLPILGTILRDRGYEVKIYCEDIMRIGLMDSLDISRSDLIGISTTTSTAPRGYRIASLLKHTKKPIVFGGVHATFMPEEALMSADYCIRGEGEETIVELVSAIENKTPLSDIRGLSFRENGNVIHNPSRPHLRNLDSVPIPDLSLIQGHERMKIIPVSTSRGCPFDCEFCTVVPMFGRDYRMESVDKVIAALEKYKSRKIFFCDDNFTASRKRTKELLREMIKRDIKPLWTAQARHDIAKDPELLSLMKKAGCYAVQIGFESINERALSSFNKKQTVEDIEHCIAMLHKHRIRIHGMFVLGADEDELDHVRETVKFAHRTKIDTVQFMILTPLPGSATFNRFEEEGRIFSRDWSLYDGYHVVFEPKSMTPLELQMADIKAMGAFYSMRRCIRSLSHLHLGTAIFRYEGHHLVKKWLRANRDYFSVLEAMQAEAGRLLSGSSFGMSEA